MEIGPPSEEPAVRAECVLTDDGSPLFASRLTPPLSLAAPGNHSQWHDRTSYDLALYPPSRLSDERPSASTEPDLASNGDVQPARSPSLDPPVLLGRVHPFIPPEHLINTRVNLHLPQRIHPSSVS